MTHSLFGIDLAALPGPTRSVAPALYFRDETVPSPSGRYFALAYTICEARMLDDVGCILWGEHRVGATHVLGHPVDLHAACWDKPWATWLAEDVVVFKAHYYLAPRLFVPLVAVHMQRGFAVLPGTDDLESRPHPGLTVPAVFSTMSTGALFAAISGAA